MYDAATAEQEKVVVPVTLNGNTIFLPLVEKATPTWLIIVHPSKASLLKTEDPNGDRIALGGVTIAEAVGRVLMEHPELSYNDIIEHMEI